MFSCDVGGMGGAVRWTCDGGATSSRDASPLPTKKRAGVLTVLPRGRRVKKRGRRRDAWGIAPLGHRTGSRRRVRPGRPSAVRIGRGVHHRVRRQAPPTRPRPPLERVYSTCQSRLRREEKTRGETGILRRHPARSAVSVELERGRASRARSSRLDTVATRAEHPRRNGSGVTWRSRNRVSSRTRARGHVDARRRRGSARCHARGVYREQVHADTWRYAD